MNNLITLTEEVWDGLRETCLRMPCRSELTWQHIDCLFRYYEPLQRCEVSFIADNEKPEEAVGVIYRGSEFQFYKDKLDTVKIRELLCQRFRDHHVAAVTDNSIGA